MQSLARANVEGKLPQLEHLDISGYQNFEISDLFTHSTEWNQLTTLETADLSVLNMESDCLTSLKELILKPAPFGSITVTRSWPHLQKLKLHIYRYQVCGNIVDSVERGLFPALETLRCPSDISTPDLFKLYKANISVKFR